MAAPLIAILTDFGTRDPFSGILKGVLATLAPGIPLVDLSHEIPSGDIRRAAVHLWQAAPYFPPETVFLAVVDPGVGTPRRAMVLRMETGPAFVPQTFVGPDNGLFTFLMQANFHAWAITNPEYMLPSPSKTFHGRDIFAPAAAYLAKGVSPANFGPALCDPVKLDLPKLESNSSNNIRGEILFADKYGNLLTSLGCFERFGSGEIQFAPWLPGLSGGTFSADNFKVELPDGSGLSLVNTFDDILPGQCAALIGSSGLLEIASNQASAAALLKLDPGKTIKVIY